MMLVLAQNPRGVAAGLSVNTGNCCSLEAYRFLT